MKIVMKITLLYFTVMLLLLMFIGTMSIANFNNAMENEFEAHLLSISSMQEERIDGILEKNDERLALLTSRVQMKTDIYAHLNNRSWGLGVTDKVISSAMESVPAITQIDIVDPEGIVITSSEPSMIGKNVSYEKYFQLGIMTKNTSMITRDIRGIPRMCAVTPLEMDGKLLGMVRVLMDMHNLYSITSDYNGLGETGEVVLGEKMENGDGVYLTPLRFDPNAGLNRTIPKNSTDTPLIMALYGESNILSEGVDYRGVEVIVVPNHIESTGWGLVVKMDKQEAFEPINRITSLIMGVMLIGALITGFIVAIVAKTIADPIVGLTSTAEALSQGKLDAEIDPALKSSNNEIGDLANAFDRTIVSLKLAMRAEKKKK